MTDPMAETLRMLDNWERDAAGKAARFQAMADRAAEVSITESVAGGAVSATVGNNGLPTDIAMTEKVREMSPDEIAANVMAAIRKAQSRYPQRLAEIVAETVGDDPAGQHVVATAQRSFPEPVEDEPTEQPMSFDDIEDDIEDDLEAGDQPPPVRRPPAAPGRDGEDGDFGGESVFDR
ncbi:YbaB/EbfC family nucleoid-associated protein [Actinophytocola sediminis]